MRGEAEAFATEAKAKAEAEQMAKKAEAWREFKEAAMVEMMLDALPKVTHLGIKIHFKHQTQLSQCTAALLQVSILFSYFTI